MVPLLKKILHIVLFLSIFLPIDLTSQNKRIDTLLRAYTEANTNEQKFKALLKLARFYSNKNGDSAIVYFHKAGLLTKGAIDKPSEVEALYAVGKGFHNIHSIDSAKIFYQRVLVLVGKLRTHRFPMNSKVMNRMDELELNALLNIGNVAMDKGNFKLAIEKYYSCLHSAENVGHKFMQASALGSLAYTYTYLEDNENSIKLGLRAFELFKELKDSISMARSLNGIGGTCINNDEYPRAIKFLLASAVICEKKKDIVELANIYGNLGIAYDQIHDNKNAMKHYLMANQIFRKTQDRGELSANLGNITSLSIKTGNFKLAEKSINEGFALALEMGDPYTIMNSHQRYFSLYKATGKWQLALKHYSKFITLKDSILNQENRNALVKKELQFHYEKQAAADSVAHAKQSEIKNVELEKQKVEISAKKNQQYALFGGLGLVIIFAGFMYNRFKITQKQKVIIEHQKEIVEEQKKIVEEKQKEVLDSIHYARRIQMAQIPSEKRIEQILVRLKKI